MKAVLTVVGKDTVGILAKVANGCAEYNVNVLEVSQSVLSDMFCMIMICDITNISCDFGDFTDKMKDKNENGIEIYNAFSFHVVYDHSL